MVVRAVGWACDKSIMEKKTGKFGRIVREDTKKVGVKGRKDGATSIFQ
jgi:hypothetical protein